MKLQLISGEIQELTKEGFQYQFSIGSENVILTSKIENCINEGDLISVVGYHFKNDEDIEVLGTTAYFNHNNLVRSSYKIPLYIFICSSLLSLLLIFYSVNLYLMDGVSYHILLLCAVLMIPNFLGYISIKAHLMLHQFLKTQFFDLYNKAFKAGTLKQTNGLPPSVF